MCMFRALPEWSGRERLADALNKLAITREMEAPGCGKSFYVYSSYISFELS
jgi:hypothetical protein